MRNGISVELATSRTALLSLEGATAEWRVGAGPTCGATVRWLDDVHFAVRPGECVVVHHDDPAGVRVFLAALSGHAAVVSRHLVRGRRVVHPRVRVRRGSIRADLVAPLIAAWRDADVPADDVAWRAREGTPLVHLLRASRAPQSHASDHEVWRAWATAQRQMHGALVIVSDERPGHAIMAAPSVPRYPSGDGRRPRQAAGIYERAPSELGPGPIRSCELRHGRMQPVHAATAQYCWPSDSPLVVGP